MKLCKDCKHFKDDYYCKTSGTKEINVVTGKETYKGLLSARTLRETDCGEEAKLFTKRSLLSRIKDINLFDTVLVLYFVLIAVLVTLLLFLKATA